MTRLIPSTWRPALLVLAASLSVGLAHADWNVTIGVASSAGAWSGASPDVWTPSASGATVAASEINTRLNAGTPVVISAVAGSGAEAGNISVLYPISSARAGASLTLTPGAGGSYSLSSPITLSGAAPSLTIAGTAYTVINDVTALQAMSGNLAGNYAIGSDIDASATATWNGGAGFVPVGIKFASFTGNFDGLGHTLTGLTINRPTTIYVGLFGYAQTGTLSNVNLSNLSVTGSASVGGLAGTVSSGSISNVITSGSVNGSTVAGQANVGGLAGVLGQTTATRSASSASVSGASNVGGLIGYALGLGVGNISQSYAMGNVTGVTNVGGLVGNNTGTVTDSYAIGNVSGGTSVGGVVGSNGGTLTNVFATGTVGGTASVGGVVGSNALTVGNAYWDTTTSGIAANAGTATNVTGLTTAQLAAALPMGFSSSVWGNAGNQTTPYLLSHTGFDTAGRVYLGTDASATPTAYGAILNVNQLQAMGNNLAGKFVLGNNIDAGATATWNGGAGFVPVGASGSPFTGNFNGLGYTINGLTINRVGSNQQGLFGYAANATLANVGLVGGSVIGTNDVGSLLGRGLGTTISASYATTMVTGDTMVGGLAGVVDASMSGSYTAATVTGNNYVGGLVGAAGATATISDCYANGTVTGAGASQTRLGGLVGRNDGTVRRTYATGTVTASGYGGRLVGQNTGTVDKSFWILSLDAPAGVVNGIGAEVGTTTSSNGAHITTLKTLSNYSGAGWAIDDAGGTANVWRIYNGLSYPLLRNFFTATLTATAGSGSKTYDGGTTTALSVSYSATPNSHLLGTASVVAASANVGTQATRVAGIYSDQTGYDIGYAGGSIVISARTVYSGPAPTGTGTISTTVTGGGPGCTFNTSQFVPLSAVATAPPAGVGFPQGLFDFTLSGCTPGSTVAVSVTYPSALPTGTQYWKYGPTPADHSYHWYTIPASISGNTITFSITDGGLGDDDLLANGTIVDQGGPGAQGAGGVASVPTLSQWGVMLLSLLLAAAGMLGARRGVHAEA